MRRFLKATMIVGVGLIGVMTLGKIVGPQPGTRRPAPSPTIATPSPTPAAIGEPIAPWPFKPDRLSLSCQVAAAGGLRVNRVYVVTDDDTTYAVNGAARPFAPLTTPIETNPDTSAVIQRGLALCRDRAGPIFIRRP